MSPPRRRSSKERHRRRSRSRSRERRKHDIRSRSRSRDRLRRHRSRSPRYRSRSPRNRSYEKAHKSRERSKDRKYDKPLNHNNLFSIPHQKNETNLSDLSNEEKDMMKMMGFCSFDTTKGKKVDGNDVGEVHVILKRKYRQYMNRKGGFNRPLDFVA